jgi:hypothetical protein
MDYKGDNSMSNVYDVLVLVAVNGGDFECDGKWGGGFDFLISKTLIAPNRIQVKEIIEREVNRRMNGTDDKYAIKSLNIKFKGEIK